MRFFLLIGLWCTAFTLYCQLPATDLYLMTFRNTDDGISLQEPEYISGFNPEGYNNQPSFSALNELVITSNYYDKEFTDFIRLDLWDGIFYRVTATEGVSEYSPTPKAIPGYFSAVRVELDGTTQSLWLYPNDHSHGGYRVLNDIGTVGYHCWLSETEVALFTVGETMNLVMANIETDQHQTILENIGRCFRQDRDGNLIFVHKIRPESWYIKSYSPDDGKINLIGQTLTGSEDFEILSDGTILMAEGSKIFSMNSGQGPWELVDDLSRYNINNINRIVNSRNKLVIVDSPKQP